MRLGFGCVGLDLSKPLAGRCLEPKRLGEACTAGGCAALLFCRDGQCVAAPRLGEACGTIGGDWAPCAIGWCSISGGAATGICEAPKKVGERCDPEANACGLYSWCDTGYCSPRCGPP